tara:strand:+ start:504 stop:854 length:351 start_codon:yes stop_codon:yes gene_type:complete
MKRKNQLDEIVGTTKRLKIKEGEYVEKECIVLYQLKNKMLNMTDEMDNIQKIFRTTRIRFSREICNQIQKNNELKNKIEEQNKKIEKLEKNLEDFKKEILLKNELKNSPYYLDYVN